MNTLLRLLGLGAPFVVAGAIYSLFRFLDNKASKAAKQAVASWIKGEKYKQLDLTAAIAGSFDNLYDAPLFRPKAFLRSVILSVCALGIYYVLRRSTHEFFQVSPQNLWKNVSLLMVPIILADYASLFLVREALGFSKTSAWLSVLLAITSALVVLEALMVVFATAVVAIVGPTLDHRTMVEHLSEFFQCCGRNIFSNEISIQASVPALIVYAWLPLLLIGALINSGIAAFFKAVGFAQWFIKRGNQHPFEAIGITTSAIAFIAAAVWQVLSLFLTH